jgi:hypothetical protein
MPKKKNEKKEKKEFLWLISTLTSAKLMLEWTTK